MKQSVWITAWLVTVALVVGVQARAMSPRGRPHSQQPGVRPDASPQPMVSVPAGRFQMGSNDGGDNEKPVHDVSVAAFEMDVTEVTVASYKACVEAGKCTAADAGDFCNWGKGAKARHPINCVDWDQAKTYCAWAGKRLPTEEEWEYGARGTERRKYPWGNEAPNERLCWNRGEGTCEVGSYSAGNSPFGLKDLAGNVWEWTESGYSPDYNSGRGTDRRVYRGGSWLNYNVSELRSAHRDWDAPTYRISVVGFRCAR